MDTQSIIELNQKRWKTQLNDLIKNIRPEITAQFKSVHIYDEHNKEVKLSDIDFSTPLLFISTVDFSYLISVYGLLKLNNVPYEDTNTSGNNSRIRTTYMIVDSSWLRYSNFDNTDGEFITYDDLEDQMKPLNYINKQLCIWRLFKHSSSIQDYLMYDMCNDRIYERYLKNHNDWIFFKGTKEEFDKSYNIPIGLNKYTISLKETKTSKERKDVF